MLAESQPMLYASNILSLINFALGVVTVGETAGVTAGFGSGFVLERVCVFDFA
jgi:hypothetical protein